MGAVLSIAFVCTVIGGLSFAAVVWIRRTLRKRKEKKRDAKAQQAERDSQDRADRKAETVERQICSSESEEVDVERWASIELEMATRGS